jgi:uncharacterized protein
MRLFIAFALGALFGVGLYVGGMTDPRKVLGFLDVAGRWDPSLALVMAGAVPVGFIAFRFAARRTPLPAGCATPAPTRGKIDRDLVVGAILFGLGWGLSGVCPGPALFNVASLDSPFVVFFLAMTAGMALEGTSRRRARRDAEDTLSG